MSQRKRDRQREREREREREGGEFRYMLYLLLSSRIDITFGVEFMIFALHLFSVLVAKQTADKD